MSKNIIFWQKNISIFWFSIIIFGWLIILGFGFDLYYNFSVNLQLNDSGRVLGSYNTNQGTMQTKAWGGGGGDVTPPTSILDNYLSDYYSSADIPDYIYGYASDTSNIQYVDLQISKIISQTKYYWEELTYEWTTTETWNSTDNYSTWSWSAINFKSNISDGVAYTINSRATDNSNYHNVETDITDESQTIFTYDISGPTTPSTLNDGTSSDVNTTTSTTELSANWSVSTDSGSGLAKYQYAIGTTSGGTDVINWTDNEVATSVTKSGLTLTNNQTYYFSVRGVDNLGNIGNAKNSDGVKVEVTSDDYNPSTNNQNSNNDSSNSTSESDNSGSQATNNSTSSSNSTASPDKSLGSQESATNEISNQTTDSSGVSKATDIKKKKSYWWWLIVLALIVYSYYRYREYKKDKKVDKNFKTSKN